MQDRNPAGVLDCLSQYQIGGPVMASNDGATSGISRDTMQAWLRDLLIVDTDSGVRVNANNALQYPPVFYAIQKVAGHLGMMSWKLSQRIGDRKHREAVEHPAYRLLRYPNHLYTGSVFTETVTGHCIFRGNGRAWIERDAYERPLKLWILLPERWKTVLIDGEKWHIGELVIDTETGATKKYKLQDKDVLHIMGFSRDGISGVDVLQLARDSIGLGMSAEKQQSKFYARNAMPGLILQSPANNLKFKKDGAAAKFLREFREMHEGVDNVGKTALLTDGVSATPLSQTGRDSQTIETRQHQREEVALWWMLESMIGEGGQSYNSEEQRQLAYLKGLPGKIKKRWEEERDAKLLTEKEKNTGSHFHQMNAGSLLQADMQSTLATLRTGIEATIYSPNDARSILGLDARDGGDEYKNPNTSSNTNTNTPPPADPAKKNLRDRLVATYRSRLEDLWQVEAKRIREAAAKGDADKFRAWLSKFYDQADWPKTFARVWTEFGGDPGVANQIMLAHCTQIASFDDFAEVEQTLKSWTEQPAELADALVDGGDN